VSATNCDAELRGLSAKQQTGDSSQILSATPKQPEAESEKKNKIKAEKIVKVKKESREAEDDEEKPK